MLRIVLLILCVFCDLRYEAYAAKVVPMIVDGVHYVNNALGSGKRILAEGACSAPVLSSCDHCMHPFC